MRAAFTDDVVWHDAGRHEHSGTYHSIDALLNAILGSLPQTWQSFSLDVHDVLSNGPAHQGALRLPDAGGAAVNITTFFPRASHEELVPLADPWGAWGPDQDCAIVNLLREGRGRAAPLRCARPAQRVADARAPLASAARGAACCGCTCRAPSGSPAARTMPRGFNTTDHRVFIMTDRLSVIITENHSCDTYVGRFPGANGATVVRTAAGAVVPLAEAPAHVSPDLSHSMRQGYVDHTTYDVASLLPFVEKRFGLRPPRRVRQRGQRCVPATVGHRSSGGSGQRHRPLAGRCGQP